MYSLALVGAWAFTRSEYPIEVYGVTCQLAEIGLAIVAVLLFRRSSAPAATAARS